jgi:hypothetical protein
MVKPVDFTIKPSHRRKYGMGQSRYRHDDRIMFSHAVGSTTEDLISPNLAFTEKGDCHAIRMTRRTLHGLYLGASPDRHVSQRK